MSRQDRMLRTWITLVSLVVASLVWLVAFSRLSWRTRGLTLLAVVVVGAGLAASVRQRGVTGDLKPIFEWRWTKRPATLEARKISAVAPTDPLPGAADYPNSSAPSGRRVLPGRCSRGTGSTSRRNCSGGMRRDRLVGICRRGSPRGDPGTTGRGRMYHLLRSFLRRPPLGTACPRTLCERTGRRRPARDPHDRWRPMLRAGSNGASPMPGPRHWRGHLGGGHSGCRCGERKSQDPRMGDERLAMPRGRPRPRRRPFQRGGRHCGERLAFRKADGSVAWKAGRTGGSFSSPIVAALAGRRHVIFFGPESVAGYTLDDGAELWSFRWKRGHPHVCMPLLLGGDDLVISSGYGTGSARLHLSRTPAGDWKAEEVWRTNTLKAKFTNLVHAGEFIYGLDDGVLACIDARDGSRRWRDGRLPPRPGHSRRVIPLAHGRGRRCRPPRPST